MKRAAYCCRMRRTSSTIESFAIGSVLQEPLGGAQDRWFSLRYGRQFRSRPHRSVRYVCAVLRQEVNYTVNSCNRGVRRIHNRLRHCTCSHERLGQSHCLRCGVKDLEYLQGCQPLLRPATITARCVLDNRRRHVKIELRASRTPPSPGQFLVRALNEGAARPRHEAAHNRCFDVHARRHCATVRQAESGVERPGSDVGCSSCPAAHLAQPTSLRSPPRGGPGGAGRQSEGRLPAARDQSIVARAGYAPLPSITSSTTWIVCWEPLPSAAVTLAVQRLGELRDLLWKAA